MNLGSTPSGARAAAACAALLPLLLPACVSTDDARAQQLLNQRGFGTRYVGDTNEQYYLGVGDVFTIADEAHPEFNDSLAVRPDGVVDARNIGEIFVAGLTIPDVEETLTRRFREFNTTAQIDVQLVASTSKFYYIAGEVSVPGRKPFEGETPLFKAVFDSGPTLLSDDDAIQLIRADPYHPLAIEFDYDDMLEGGWSLANVEVRENDIIYVPPNFWGYLTNLMIMIFSPIDVITSAVFSADRLIFTVDTFGDTDRFRGRGGRGRFGMVAPATGRDFEMQLAPVDPALLGAQ